MSAASKTQKAGMNQRARYRRFIASPGLFVDMEDLLYVRAEVAGERDREGQRGRVALLLDRVDRLARNGHRLAELLLGEAALGPQLLDTVVHRPGDVKVALHHADVKRALLLRRQPVLQRTVDGRVQRVQPVERERLG